VSISIEKYNSSLMYLSLLHYFQKLLKAINHLKEKVVAGSTLNEEQLKKVDMESEWIAELESVEHNLM